MKGRNGFRRHSYNWIYRTVTRSVVTVQTISRKRTVYLGSQTTRRQCKTRQSRSPAQAHRVSERQGGRVSRDAPWTPAPVPEARSDRDAMQVESEHTLVHTNAPCPVSSLVSSSSAQGGWLCAAIKLRAQSFFFLGTFLFPKSMSPTFRVMSPTALTNVHACSGHFRVHEETVTTRATTEELQGLGDARTLIFILPCERLDCALGQVAKLQSKTLRRKQTVTVTDRWTET